MPRSSIPVLLAALLTFLLASAPAQAGRDAEHYVGTLLQQTSVVLRDTYSSAADRRERLHGLLLANLDARKAALFALGPYQRDLDPQTTEAYVAAFTDYITAVYEARLQTFRTFDFRVVTSTDANQSDATVVTQATPPPEFHSRAPMSISLRISRAGGAFKIVDVQIAGIWVSMYQRDQFARRLAEARGDLHAMTSYLNAQAAQIKAGNAEV